MQTKPKKYLPGAGHVTFSTSLGVTQWLDTKANKSAYLTKLVQHDIDRDFLFNTVLRPKDPNPDHSQDVEVSLWLTEEQNTRLDKMADPSQFIVSVMQYELVKRAVDDTLALLEVLVAKQRELVNDISEAESGVPA